MFEFLFWFECRADYIQLVFLFVSAFILVRHDYDSLVFSLGVEDFSRLFDVYSRCLYHFAKGELDAWLNWYALESKICKTYSWISTHTQMIKSRCIAFKLFTMMQYWDKCYINFKKINEITFQTTSRGRSSISCAVVL
nr:hypothetical protein [Tanacetum cinerariifolium]